MEDLNLNPDTDQSRVHVQRPADTLCPTCGLIVMAGNTLSTIDPLSRELAVIGAMDFHTRHLCAGATWTTSNGQPDTPAIG